MPSEAVMTETFAALKALLVPYAAPLVVVKDAPDEYYLDAHNAPVAGAQPSFASAKIGKRYVSFHLMPVYVYPELLQEMSPELRKRMQGKSCFNFTKPEAALFAEGEA
jgi:hypothetical protein